MTRKFSITPYLFLTPALLVIAVFVLYPIFAVVYYSFTDYDIITPPVWVGLKNYAHLLSDDVFRQALLHSFIYLIATPIVIVLSIGLAILVNRKLPGINLFRGLYYIPAISGSIAVGIIWRWLFDAQGGAAERRAHVAGGDQGPGAVADRAGLHPAHRHRADGVDGHRLLHDGVPGRLAEHF